MTEAAFSAVSPCPPSRPKSGTGRLPDESGFPGEVLTELQAVSILTGARTELVAAGGVGGAEGSVWLAVGGTAEQEEAAGELLHEVINEPPFAL